MTKVIYPSLFLFILLTKCFGQFSKFGLQTSDILELHRGKNYKAIFAGEIITVDENYKRTKDTLFYRELEGTFILFWHDSIKSSDTLIMMPHRIRNYYVLVKEDSLQYYSVKSNHSIFARKKEIDLKRGYYGNHKFIKDIIPIKIYYYSITKITQGRRTYKMRKTTRKDKVWQ